MDPLANNAINKNNMISKSERERLEKKLYAPDKIGSDLRDWERPIVFNTALYQFYREDSCMMNLPNLIQTNRRHIKLPDKDLVNINSELKGITRYLSKIPTSKYLGPTKCEGKYNNKGICICPHCLKKNVVNQNSKVCKKKIINNKPKIDYTKCGIRRTDSANNDCTNQVVPPRKDEGVVSYLTSFFR